jgi:ketosteroid isomerase-like protein
MSALSPADVVTAYFAGVTAGDAAAVTALFAPDAVLRNAAGTLTGSEAIGRMYHGGLNAGTTMRPSPRRLLVDGDDVAVEIDLEVNGNVVVLGDFFTVRDGLISSLSIYSLTPAGGRLLDDVGVDPASPKN